MPNEPCVYVLASKRNGTLYIGVGPRLVPLARCAQRAARG
jgi:predicted GIY-YIG superfamily endonuclease